MIITLLVLLAAAIIWGFDTHSKLNSLIQKHELEKQKMQSEKEKEIFVARSQAIKQSKSVIKGQISEQIAPFLPGFPYCSSDLNFLGKPIDAIIWKGMSEGKVEEIILMDIKTGNADLTTRQRQIRDCIKDGRVSFEIFKPEQL